MSVSFLPLFTKKKQKQKKKKNNPVPIKLIMFNVDRKEKVFTQSFAF